MTILNADEWLIATLKGDATFFGAMTGGVWAEYLPGDTYPAAVVQMVTGSIPVANAYADTIMFEEGWQVALITNLSDYGGLEAAADRAIAVLHKQASAPSGILECIYTGAQRLAEQEGESAYRRIVLEFRILTQ